MNLSLYEALGDANPHYCRVPREKMAAKEASHQVMEARKAAMVEASWCRILKAARIDTKEAESLPKIAENNASEAFTALGVVMF
ncbi:hypothetical protein MLD38_023304 [Melastoma candidum]|uniref:Uncharacterized protein n=1 Tax=Melastoma candidum TaxID=119954 RepID=A0ACB9QQ57_9MYRT|nr:hypothetical protein MLD38_023304 [Melastoma candidum]